VEPTRQQKSLLLAAIGLVAVLARVIPASSVQWVSSDAVEYLNIAQRLSSGEGFTLSIKAYHYIPGPLTHYAGWDRPLLFPMALAALRFLTDNPLAPQFLNLCLAVVAAGTGALLSARIYGWRAAGWTGLLLALAPALVRTSLYPWSEPLALGLGLGAMLAFARPDRSAGFLSAGLLCGAAFLARPVSALLFAVMAAFVAFTPGVSLAHKLRRLVALCAGFALLAIVQVLINVANGAPLLTTAQSFLFRTLHFQQGMYFEYGQWWESSAFGIVSAGPRGVALEIYRHLRDYSKALLFDSDWLFLYSPMLALIAWRGVRRRLSQPQFFLLTVALLTLGFHILTWSTKDIDRFMQWPFVLLLILAVGELDRFCAESNRIARFRHAARFLTPALALVMIALYACSAVGIARESLQRRNDQWPMKGIYSENWINPDSAALHDWLREETEPDAALASTNPWALNFHSGRPAALLPFDMDRLTLERFIADFDIDYLIVNHAYPHPVYKRDAGYESDLKALGVDRTIKIGSYEVFDVKFLQIKKE